MAYDRYDTRDLPRDERDRWSRDRDLEQGRGRESDRGFFERAGDEVASWFGDEDAERRRREDRMREEREGRFSRDYSTTTRRETSRDWDRDRERSFPERDEQRGRFVGSGRVERDRSVDRNRDRERTRGYRPMTGDYGRGDYESEQFFAASGYGRGERGISDYERSRTPYGREEVGRTSFAGSSDRSRDYDPHYHSWRQRHLSELDRDYDDYRREHQSKFENDFTSWRERRQHKRGLLGQIREHMEVVGKDDQHVGTIDCVAGDRIVLTKSDPESGGTHHSLSCADIDRIEGDRVVLDLDAETARQRWRDESRSRALFERQDQGEMGPRMLDRSFEGTYR